MIRALGLLHLRRLGRPQLRTIVAVVAVAAGSSLALSVVVVRSSLDSSLARFGRALAGPAPLRVIGAVSSGGLEQGLADRITGVPGVAAGVAVVQVATVVRQANGTLRPVVALGIGDGPTTVSGVLARRLGARSWLQTATGVVPLAGDAAAAALDRIDGGAVVTMSLARAQQLFDRAGRVDVVYVEPRPGVAVAALAARLRGVVAGLGAVLSATDPPPEVVAALTGVMPLLTILAVLAAAIAAVLVFNVVSLSLEERRRDEAVAAAVGAPPGLLVAGTLLEAGIVGAVGGAVGAAAGGVLAAPTVHSLSIVTEHAVGVPVLVHLSAGAYVLGTVVGLLIGICAALVPLRRALRRDVVAELSGREMVAEHRRALSPRVGTILSGVVGVSLLVEQVAARHGALAPWQAPAVSMAFLVCVLAGVVAVGYWAPLLLSLVARRPTRRPGVRLALSNVVREPGRTGVVAVAVAAAVGVALMTASYNQSIHDSVAASVRTTSEGRGLLVTTAAGAGNENADSRIPMQALATLARLPGVARLDEFRAAVSGTSGTRLVLVESVDDLPTGLVVDAGRPAPGGSRSGAVMVGAGLARRRHLRPGSRLVLDTPGGPASVVVAGVWELGDFGGLNVTMSPARFASLYGDQLPSAVVAVGRPGEAPAALRAAAASAGLPADLRFSTPARVVADTSASATAQLAPFWALQRALLLVAFVSVLSTLLLAGLQRRREFGLLAAVGLAPGEQSVVVLGEALAVALVGSVLGTLMGVVDMGSLLPLTPLLVGFHDPYRLDLATLVVYVPLALSVALAASLWPAWRAGRVMPVDALRYE